jgi:hypothetical protein
MAAACAASNLGSPGDAAAPDAREDSGIVDAAPEALEDTGTSNLFPDADAAPLTNPDGSCISAASMLDGGCGDPQTDPHNCGGCGHDCDGGACVSGACAPLPANTLATGLYAPSAIAVDANAVYWLDWGTPVGGGGKIPPIYAGAQVLSCAKGGCGNGPTALATMSPTSGLESPFVPSAMAMDIASVYWPRGGDVVSCAKGGCGCNPGLVGSVGDVTAIGLSPSMLYVAQYALGQLAMCPLPGCSSVTITASHVVGADGIALDTTYVYWVDSNGEMLRCPLSGCNGAPQSLWRGAPGSTQAGTVGIAVDATNVYWTNAQPFTYGSVMQCAKEACAGTLVTLAAGRDEPRGIAVDGTNVYWTDAAGLQRCTLGGCGGMPTTLASSAGPALALDATHVYFTDPGTKSTDGRIHMIAK